MWSKFTHALKPHLSSSKDEGSVASQSQGEVMNRVYEQHPNLSMFQPNEVGVTQQHTAEVSPSVHSKRSMFKRMSKGALKEDMEGFRAPSPFQQPPSLPKKLRNMPDFSSNVNDSQSSFAASQPQEVARRSSFDMLRPSPPRQSQDTTRSVKDSRRRPSLDILRDLEPRNSPESVRVKNNSVDSDFLSPGDKMGAGSVRSILRDRNTPGTGQSVRFFSRDAFKVITPDHSLSTEALDKPQPAIPQDDQAPFLERLTQATQPTSSTPLSLTRMSSGSKPRPKLAGVFSPLTDQENVDPNPDQSDASASFSNGPLPMPPQEFANLFDVSAQLDMPSFPPPGLDFNVDAPVFEASSFTSSANDISYVVREENFVPQSDQMTSTPLKSSTDSKGKGKEVAMDTSIDMDTHVQSIPISAPAVIDETIFHRKEKSPKFAPPLHERSQSFSFGQTVFYSVANNGEKSREEMEASYPSSDIRPSVDNAEPNYIIPSPPPPSKKSQVRSRAMSDTAFQDMLRGTSSPEADINDDFSRGLVVYSGAPDEPDPFSANANTYYTPQVMIPITPPKGTARHFRKTSKEESLIISLQTELSLKTELCAQYETDLKARDELVEILGKKLSDVEKDEARRRSALRAWKKKVQELEKTCRQLEEAMDRSRMESMERSVMDEASSEALRMLHRQIAGLEREKNDWVRTEHSLKEQVETLEALVRERDDDVANLKETLWNRDESERELKDGIRDAKDQIEMLGNISLVGVDEEELKRLMMEKDQKNSEETQRFRMRELELQDELDELKTKYEGLEVQKGGWAEDLERLNEQLKMKDEEYATLKTELEAQWQHTEKTSEKMEVIEQEKTDLEAERDALKADVENLEVQVSNMESDWTESENKRNELEAELQEVWNLKDALEQERGQLEDALQQEQATVQELRTSLQDSETRISEFEQEKQFAYDCITRLEDNIRKRDEELTQYTQRVVSGEGEAEQLREEMSKLKREHSHLVNEQARALQDAAGQQSELKGRLDELVKAKAERDVELKTNKDRVAALKDEVERLRRQHHTLQQDSADKDMKIVQMTKQISQEKEDLLGLNIALESKQQELELIKRKLNVRGTAGSTPAQPSKVAHRRDSSIFTATPLSRPPSALSESGPDVTNPPRSPTTVRKERKNSTETPQVTTAAKLALARSTRVNGSGNSSVSSSATKGTMGPPPLKSRPSVNGTPTPIARGSVLGRSSSARPAVTSPTQLPMSHRRASSIATSENGQARSKLSRSSVNASPAPSVVSELDEKENVNSTSTPSRRSMIPALA